MHPSFRTAPPTAPEPGLGTPAPAAGRSTGVFLVVLVALAAIAVIWAIAFERVRFEREQAIEAEGVRNDNLALAHEERAARSIDLLDQLLRDVRRDLKRGGVPDDLSERVQSLGRDAGYVIALSVLDARGERIAAHPPGPAPNYADRDYFRHHAQTAEDRLLIGAPVVGKISGRWTITFTRRVEAPGGGFGGVVFLSIDPAFFVGLLERSGVGANGSLALIGTDGLTRVRRNGSRISFGDDARKSRLFDELQRAPAGRYSAKAASDGVVRIASYRTLDTYPLIAVVASSLDDVLAGLAVRERTTWGTAAAGSLLVVALAVAVVSGRRRSERALAVAESQEHRFRLVFENSFDPILRTRPGGHVLGANPAACRVFGLEEAQLIGLGPAELVDPSDPRLPVLVDERARTGRAHGTLRMRRGDGSLFEAEVSSSVYVDADGQPATSMIVRDLTQRQASEAERAQLEARMRETQKLEAIGTLAGGIAHDFNNILAAILGSVRLATDDLPADHPVAAPLARVRQAALRGRALVQKILTFSRRQPERREAVELQAALREAVDMLRATLPATAALEVRFTDEPVVVMADPTQLQQVLLNLCTNAWQALPDHKGHIRVVLERVDAGRCGTPGACAVLRVEDDGIGMDAATQARLFEPFFTTKPIGEGTGIGLSVVHGIVHALGGRIDVRSTPGAGSCFEVCLPTTAPPAGAPVEPPPAASERPGRGERILCIDDDEVVLLTLESLLQRAGYHVSTCASAPEALARFGAEPQAFDAIVTDYNMPETSGLDLFAAMDRLRPGLPAVVTSGSVSGEMQARAAALGVRQLLPKEDAHERLAGALREALDTRVS